MRSASPQGRCAKNEPANLSFRGQAEIAKENKIRGTKWAEASGLSPSRASDFKRLTKKTNAGAAEPELEHDVWKHTFSLNNFFALWNGLKRLVGTTALRRDLIRQLQGKKTPSTRVRIFLRLMTFNDGQLKMVDAFTDALLHRVNTISNRNER
jgi:hypothetical protein